MSINQCIAEIASKFGVIKNPNFKYKVKRARSVTAKLVKELSQKQKQNLFLFVAGVFFGLAPRSHEFFLTYFP